MEYFRTVNGHTEKWELKVVDLAAQVIHDMDLLKQIGRDVEAERLSSSSFVLTVDTKVSIVYTL